VSHSHNYSLPKLMFRAYDDFRGIKLVLGQVPRLNIFSFVPFVLRGIFKDLIFLFKNKEHRSFYWAQWIIWANILRTLGIYLGSRYDKYPSFVRNFFSLEARRRSYDST
jgi:hypothetical protein